MALKKKKQRHTPQRGPHHKGAPETAPKQSEVIADDYPDGLSVEEIIAKRELEKNSAPE